MRILLVIPFACLLMGTLSYKELHKSAIVIDTHDDTTQRLLDPNFDLSARHADGAIDIPRMRDGGLTGIFFSIWMPSSVTGPVAVKKALDQIDIVREQARKYPKNILLATSADDIVRAKKEGKIAALMGVEGGHMIDNDLSVLRTFASLGVRYMTLTHTANNDWAGASTDKEQKGLSDFGRKVVEEMNRLGMMIDISHVSDRTFYDVLAVSKAPVIASHSSCRSLVDVPRNMSDQMMHELAKNGGVVHINYYEGFIDKELHEFNQKHPEKEKAISEELKTQCKEDAACEILKLPELLKKSGAPSVRWERIVEHIVYAVKVAGIDHVGLGSDFDGAPMPHGMEDATHLPQITQALKKRGYSDSDIRKILGENTLRVMREVEAVSRVNKFELNEATIAQLQEKMESGAETSRSLVEKYLARIETIDGAGPELRSVIEINPDARSISDSLDSERKAGKVRGPLHGIPVLIKDNIATADRMKTTAGSLALVDAHPPFDAPVVTKLRDAGAVILGKTNMSEWANFRSTHSVSGWSARGGQVKNPYALDRNPSGSSSGSAVAVAANLSVLAVGTETDGSIVSPSAANGDVGIKPTVGLISSDGIIPIAARQDTPGPIARTVSDAALLLGAMVGKDYSKGLSKDSLRGVRIGVVRKTLTGYSPATDRIFETAIHDLKRLGATIVDPTNIETIDDIRKCEMESMLYEFREGIERYLKGLGAKTPLRNLDDLIHFDETHQKEEMSLFGQELFQMAKQKGSLGEVNYINASQLCRELSQKRGIDAVMDKYALEALIAPTGAPAWLTDTINGDKWSGGSATVAAVAGYPHITVPAGFVAGLPIGLSFFGRALSEEKLIGLAYAYEQATRHRQPPQFLKSANTDS